MPGPKTPETKHLERAKRQFFQYWVVERLSIREIKRKMDQLSIVLGRVGGETFFADERVWEGRRTYWNKRSTTNRWNIEDNDRGPHNPLPPDLLEYPIWREWDRDVGDWNDVHSGRYDHSPTNEGSAHAIHPTSSYLNPHSPPRWEQSAGEVGRYFPQLSPTLWNSGRRTSDDFSSQPDQSNTALLSDRIVTSWTQQSSGQPQISRQTQSHPFSSTETSLDSETASHNIAYVPSLQTTYSCQERLLMGLRQIDAGQPIQASPQNPYTSEPMASPMFAQQGAAFVNNTGVWGQDHTTSFQSYHPLQQVEVFQRRGFQDHPVQQNSTYPVVGFQPFYPAQPSGFGDLPTLSDDNSPSVFTDLGYLSEETPSSEHPS